MYLTYEEYRVLGGTAEEGTFCRSAFAAGRKIDFYTSGRIRADMVFYGGITHLPYTEALKRLVVELVPLLSSSDERTLTGVSNDGYSESYQTFSPEESNANTRRIISQYLSEYKDHKGVLLLYRGV